MTEPHVPGGRVRLRRWQRDDLDALLLHADDAAVSRGLSEQFPYPYTRADGQAFLSGQVVDLSGPTFALVIDGQACGGIGVAVERDTGTASLGYWLGQRHWGQGIMSAVVAAYAPWVMDELRLRRIAARVMAHNHASARVLRKNGFVEERVEQRAMLRDGQWHDIRHFARLR